MKKTLVLLTAALALTGCKIDGGKNQNPEGGGGIGPILTPKERAFTTSELTIGRRICAALKQKRLMFEKLNDMQEKFRVKGELKNCQTPNPYNIAEFNVAISNSNSTDYEYVATNRAKYFKDVVTDQTGAMNILCDNLGKSDNVSNQIISGSSYLLVNLLISEGYDRFEVSKQTADGAGNFKLVSIESVMVITQKNQADEKFFGVEKERVRYTPCPTPDSYEYTKQTWVAPITPF